MLPHAFFSLPGWDLLKCQDFGVSCTAGSDDEPVVQVQVLGVFCDGRIIKSIGNIEERQAAQPVAG